MTDPTPRITDAEVALLPVRAGRADLLEDLMATPVTRRPTVSAWFAVPAAAAAIAAIALVPTVRSALDGPAQVQPAPLTSPSSTSAPEQGVRSVPGGRYFVLDDPAWRVAHVSEGGGFSSVAYTSGSQTVELTQYAADQYDSYYRDRLDVSEPTPTRFLGKESATFTYSVDDHATIRPAESGRFLEVRGSGMNLAAYDALLATIVQTDERGLAASLPEDVVTPFNRDTAVAHLLEGVEVPEGFTAADVDIEGFNDAYQSAARVAGSVGCAWLDHAAGGEAARARALAAFDGSRGWPLLTAIAGDGGYADVFWGVADQLRRGDPVEGIRPGIC